MSSLSRDFRGTLKSTVRNARAAAEAGAGKALKSRRYVPSLWNGPHCVIPLRSKRGLSAKSRRCSKLLPTARH